MSEESKPQRILIIDDDSDSVRFLTKALESCGYQIDSANEGNLGIQKLKKFKPHLVLLDIQMPGTNGITVLRQIRQIEENDYTAVIFVSGRSTMADVVVGLDEGADDYVVKPYQVPELLSRIRAKLRVKEIHDELKVKTKKLEELTQVDDLTGLLNMRTLYQKLGVEQERSRRYGKTMASIMMDMDYFKSVNDNNDHIFGSWILARVAEVIKKETRSLDLAARYGGDEYLVILPDTTMQGAINVATRIKEKIESREFQLNDQKAKLTCSFGVFVFNPTETQIEPKEFVREADRLLYEAKESGRNCIKSKQYTKP